MRSRPLGAAFMGGIRVMVNDMRAVYDVCAELERLARAEAVADAMALRA